MIGSRSVAVSHIKLWWKMNMRCGGYIYQYEGTTGHHSTINNNSASTGKKQTCRYIQCSEGNQFSMIAKRLKSHKSIKLNPWKNDLVRSPFHEFILNSITCYTMNPYYSGFMHNMPLRRYSTYQRKSTVPLCFINVVPDQGNRGPIKSGLRRNSYNSQGDSSETFQSESSQIQGIGNASTVNEKKPHYLHFHPSCTPETLMEITSSFQVVNDYLSKEEEEALMKEIEPHLKRLHYEFDHWDDAIHGYRETEHSRWGKATAPIITKTREFAFPKEKDFISQIHILDLAKSGVIKPHVDSIRFCGNVICGLCLLSDAVMRLVHTENQDQIADVMLPRRSVYIMKDDSRFKYTHEVLGEEKSIFNVTAVPRDRRVSILFRNNPKEQDN